MFRCRLIKLGIRVLLDENLKQLKYNHSVGFAKAGEAAFVVARGISAVDELLLVQVLFCK